MRSKRGLDEAVEQWVEVVEKEVILRTLEELDW